MRILYCAAGTPIPGTHGGSVHALELCRALARRGHEVHLAALPPAPSANGGTAGEREGGSSTDSANAHNDRQDPVVEGTLDGIILHPVRRLLSHRLLEWTAAGQLRQLITELRPDVVVERFYTFGGAGVSAAHRLGVPVVLEINSPARAYPGSLRDALDKLSIIRPVNRWRRRMLARSTALYATSRHLVPPELQRRVTVIVNGVDVKRFRPGSEIPDAGPLRCAYVSSFRAWHGAEDLVQAVALCVARGVDLHVTCVGEGPRYPYARRAAEEAGLTHQIEFTGRVPHDRVPGLLAAAHVGLAPFAPEQFRALELGWFWSPIKIFEYLATGLAVVTADIAELRALLPPSVATFYTTGDPASLADQIARLSGNRSALRGMGRAARTLALERYTWDHQAEAVEAVLQSALR